MTDPRFIEVVAPGHLVTLLAAMVADKSIPEHEAVQRLRDEFAGAHPMFRRRMLATFRAELKAMRAEAKAERRGKP